MRFYLYFSKGRCKVNFTFYYQTLAHNRAWV